MITTSQRIFTILFLFPAFCASPAFSQGERGRRDDPFDREEMLRRFDTDGDGELNNAEREKMRDFILQSLQERPGGDRPEGGRGVQPPGGAAGGGAAAAVRHHPATDTSRAPFHWILRARTTHTSCLTGCYARTRDLSSIKAHKSLQ